MSRRRKRPSLLIMAIVGLVKMMVDMTIRMIPLAFLFLYLVCLVAVHLFAFIVNQAALAAARRRESYIR